MTRKLEEILNVEPTPGPFVDPATVPVETAPAVDLQEKLDEFDKISAALPKVRGLGELSDTELDSLAGKAEKAYEDLMDLGMNVEARYGARMFEVAANMLNAAITAKSAKIDKKLRMVELQIKKEALDKKNNDNAQPVEGEGYILTDRNSILEKLKKMNK